MDIDKLREIKFTIVYVVSIKEVEEEEGENEWRLQDLFMSMDLSWYEWQKITYVSSAQCPLLIYQILSFIPIF